MNASKFALHGVISGDGSIGRHTFPTGQMVAKIFKKNMS